MNKVLVIHSSILDDNSNTRLLTRELLEQLGKQDGIEISERDLAVNPIPHLDGASIGAFFTSPAERTPEQAQLAARSDQLIEELKAHDIIVIGAPMYNLGIPSQLKAYFDHVARAGVTFKYTETGPVGLLENKKVYVISASGGRYAGTPMDTLRPHVENFLKLIGLSDIEFIRVEGVSMPEHKEQQLAQARERIKAL